ncbi:MAG: DNA repair protein RecN [Planctomycetota bacterium]|nr:DNA repair protein RecN [Planctomycetota bacterium]
MLAELSIRDLALIEAAELSFGTGLNVITGETGAGKSLLVGALDLILGGRPKAGAAGLVRAGAKEARLEARFELDASSERGRAVAAFLDAELEDFSADFAETGELILGRSLTSAGRTRARINQRPVPLKALRTLAGILIELHGQNDHQRLCLPGEQRRLLDAFGGHAKVLDAYAAARSEALAAADALSAFHERRTERRDRIDLLRYQLEELDGARLEPGERGHLGAERELLRHAGELSSELGGVAEALSEGDSALLDILRTMERRVEAWRARVPGLDDAAESLREAVVHTEEAASALVSYTDNVEVDPARLEEVEERMAELERLADKYARDDAGLLELLAELAAELEDLEAEEGGSDALERQATETLAALEKAADKLTRARKKAAKPLAKEVEAALAGLGLEKARFEARLVPLTGEEPVEEVDGVTFELGAVAGAGEAGDLGQRVAEHLRALLRLAPHGAERIEFLLAANPGEPAGALAKVASGGEVARIMLALRGVLSACEQGRTLVFDEIDSGVGGRLGPHVAARLRQLGEGHQVLCVTHLPSIAAAAHLHLKVAKGVAGGRTTTIFQELSGDPRLRELADMIAGGADEDTARAEAARLLQAH